MTTFLLIVHIIVSIALIGIVLIQGGKGAEIGATFGAGASQTVFGATGGKSFVGRMTTMVAVVFMLTSLGLTYFYARPGTTSVMPTQVTVEQQQTTPAPEAQAEKTAEQPASPVQPEKSN
ncbi:MAG: preprotein translocase subunit SecG [Deltaproteobacteria bacterium]|nr:preprotein translocase subunit SecG [Deltaproteobacteria bacterium]